MFERAVRILLVEDSPSDAKLAEIALKESSVRTDVIVVQNGVAALDYLFARNGFKAVSLPDLIILDLNLPQKDGREVLREIKDDPVLKKIPVLILTTSDSADDIAKCYELHCNCYFTKPLDFNQFVHLVKSIEEIWMKDVELPTLRRRSESKLA